MRRRGFSLLEVMVAIAILAGSLVALTVAISRSVQASAHARMMTVATSLCRMQLTETEEKFIVDGFTDDAFSVEEKGDFEDPQFKRFHWTRTIDKIQLPTVDEIQTAATKKLQDTQTQAGQGTSSIPGLSGTGGSGGSGGAGGALGGGALGAVLGPVKEMLEQGIRRVTVRVLWDEPGRPGQQVEVVAFYTDPRRIPVF